jgi:hypothetical protein
LTKNGFGRFFSQTHLVALFQSDGQSSTVEADAVDAVVGLVAVDPVTCQNGCKGCQIFLDTMYQNRKYVPNEHKMYIPNGPM